MRRQSHHFSSIGSDDLIMESRLSFNILCAKNEVIGMEIQLKEYKNKHGENDRYVESKERISIIWDALKLASMIDDECYARRVYNTIYLEKINNLHAENKRLKEELESSKKEIESARKAWEAL